MRGLGSSSRCAGFVWVVMVVAVVAMVGGRGVESGSSGSVGGEGSAFAGMFVSEAELNTDLKELFGTLPCVDGFLRVLEEVRAESIAAAMNSRAEETASNANVASDIGMNVELYRMFVYQIRSLTYASRMLYRMQKSSLASKSFGSKVVLDPSESSETLKRRLGELQRCNLQSHPKVVVCTIQHFNDIATQEFVVHHLLMGVSKVVIYEGLKPNSPQSNAFRISMKPLVESGFVEIVSQGQYPNGTQAESQNHCFQQQASQSNWVALLEPNEFIVLHSPHSQCLNEIMTGFNEFSGLRISKRNVLPYAGQLRNKTRLLTENYIQDIGFAGSGLPRDNVQFVLNSKYANSITENSTSFSLGSVNLMKEKRHDYIETRRIAALDIEAYIYETVCSDKPGINTTAAARNYFNYFSASDKPLLPPEHANIVREFFRSPV